MRQEAPRSFDDVFSFFENGSGARGPGEVRHEPGQQPLREPQANTLNHGVGPTMGPGISSQGLGEVLDEVSSSPSTAELNLILRAVQACVGEFPTIELGAVAERPEHLRKWHYSVFQILEAAGPQVIEWWSWCWNKAEESHNLYQKAPIMIREGINVDHETRHNGVKLRRG